MSWIPTEFIEAELTLFPESEGGHPIYLEKAYYRPHIVVGDVAQRKAVIKDGNVLIERYLGVQFRREPKILKPGETNLVVMDLMYYPEESYEEAKPGSGFTLREGPKIVGYGTIKTSSLESKTVR